MNLVCVCVPVRGGHIVDTLEKGYARFTMSNVLNSTKQHQHMFEDPAIYLATITSNLEICAKLLNPELNHPQLGR